jgi:ubiquinone/menaquinone biosynthesis C-methylase UbiE
MKLHICCGDVYLQGYINVDIQGNIEHNEIGTTLDNYYTKPFSKTPRQGKDRNFFPVDLKLNILEPWPWKNNEIDEIVMIQALEHFTREEAKFVIGEIYRILKIGGVFILDFPDIIKTFRKYKNDFNYLTRLIYCTYIDQYSIHKTAYDKKTIKTLLKENGRKWFIEFKSLVDHDYPTIGVFSIKK